MGMLQVRLLADRTVGERVERFDPETGERKLINPATPGDDHEPWPLLGLEVVGEAPATCNPPTSWVERGVREGWLVLEGARPVVRPGGPPDDPMRRDPERAIPHLFMHADVVVLKTVDGDVRYRVVRQPDKYVDDSPDDELMTDEHYAAGNSRIDWFYGLELED